ncbi:hypothetical protein [Litorimonas sp.]|uniref:hypothetical protein n=1 Tax=Litorimonas sp. TaxID=1892381 RepID=UPI003A8395CD
MSETINGRTVERQGDTVVTYAPWMAKYMGALPAPKPVHGNSKEHKSRYERTHEALKAAIRD